MGLYTVKSYNFKSYGCDEVAWFSIPFAIKEYLQNTQGQILKTLQVRKWRDWETLDLSEDSTENLERREKAKARLLKTDPCLFAGDQGKAIAKSKLCQPRYILEATIPLDESRDTPRDHDFRAIIILWGFKNQLTGSDEAKALTVYNNYLDKEAKFSHFVHDGSSTSKGSRWAVGLKGKGFMLSTSYLAQICQDFREKCDSLASTQGCHINDICKNLLGMSGKPLGVGFNVGSRFAKGEYNKASPRMLKIKKEDLRALSISQFRRENPNGKCKDVESDEESDSEAECRFGSQQALHGKPDKFYQDRLEKTYKKRGELHIAEKFRRQKEKPVSSPDYERPLVRDDDVCVHVIGLPGSLNAEEAFSAVFGIFKEPTVWKIPGTLFEAFPGKDKFYHRDQHVPVKSPLKGLSINYHGDLRLSSDRMEIISHGKEFLEYNIKLREAIEKAVSTIPELATLIMKSMLSGENTRNLIKPLSQNHATEYNLIRELGFFPWPLGDWQMEVLENAGAYVSIRELARTWLLNAEAVSEGDLPGLSFLNHCIRQLIPDLKNKVSVRKYGYSTPWALHRDGNILLAQPEPCKKCIEAKCECWIGPSMVRIMQEYKKDADLDEIFLVYDQEKRAKERERVSNPSRVQNPSTEQREDGPQADTSSTDRPSQYGLTVGYTSGEESGGDDVTVIESSKSEKDGDWQPSRSSGGYQKTSQTPRKNKTDNSQKAQVKSSISNRLPRKHLAGYVNPVENAAASTPNASMFQNDYRAQGTPSNAQAESSTITEAIEKLLPAVLEVDRLWKANDFSVHRQLVEHVTNCVHIIGCAHQEQINMLTLSGSRGDAHGAPDGSQGSKRKRTN